MAKKKKFDAVKQVKAMSRAQFGTVAKTRLIPDKRRKPPKHKKLEEE